MTLDVLLLGIAMAISPLAVLASVLLLTTERGTLKAVAYAVGWVVAVGAVGVLTVLASSQVDAAPGSSTSTSLAALDVALGVLLVGWAFRRRAVLGGAGLDGAVPQPGWMRRLDGMSPVVALGFGLFMPPYAVAVAAASSIIRADGTGRGSGAAVAVVGFTVIASLGVIVPPALAVASTRSADALGRLRGWLLDRWPTVLFWMLLVLGAYLVAKGVYAL